MSETLQMRTEIMASLAAADPLHLAEAIEAAEKAGVDRLHLDIEDGNFVPNITFGLKLVQAVRAYTSLPLCVHLMSSVSEKLIEELSDLKLESISVHFEAVDYPLRALALIRRSGAKAGLALNPRTPIEDVAYAAPHCDSLLIMTNEPDTLGAQFLDSSYARIAAARRLLFESTGKADGEIIADGDIDADNIQSVVAAGATSIVCGRAIFDTSDIAANLRALRRANAPR